MKKDNVLFGIIGLLAGLIIGFLVTNAINKDGYAKMSSPVGAQTGQQLPQIDNKVVKDQDTSVPGGAAMPQVQQVIDKAQKEPDNFEAQMAAGAMYAQIQRFDKAVEFFERANKLQPDNYQTIVSLGNINFDLGKYDVAEKWYATALSKKSDDVNVRTDLGLTFFLRQPQDVERAIQEYKKSLEINPNHELTLQNLAVAQQTKGDTAGLNETIAKLEKINPQNPAIQRLRGSN